ncbi:FAD-dependent oxidoreductase [Amycolatopsis sp. A133]|uniref:FAD-binding oxidoreductase n=1 Tax=Amycolatopsis sp. A133 TaxID=3064472 RepID=UPI0027F9D5AD|nr:FAD-dependent oxidoreductase [Amycolatopsis sp. A133]MDQ7809127.1 FAD-dependent oxidoreductase [Amycolatopsis sp. A133]
MTQTAASPSPASAVRGRVLLAADAGFAEAARPWNRHIEQSVAAVVEVADADDIAGLVRYAGTHGWVVTVQPSGHGATGDTGAEDAPVVLVRTGRLNRIIVDQVARTARVGAGVTWGQLQVAAAPSGLTGLPGSSPVVSVVGFILGGGLSWFSRRHGWGADSVLAFEIVDAAGRRRRIGRSSDGSDAELFWALLGGGGDVAVVTEVEVELHPAPAVYGGRMVWPATHADEVLSRFREVTASAPESLTVWTDLLRFPGADPLVAIDTTYLGDSVAARALLAPFDRVSGRLSDSRAVLRADELGAITAEPTAPSAGLSCATLLTGFDEHTAKALIAAPTERQLSVQVRHLGGALAGPTATASGPLVEPYLLYLFGLPGTPEATTAVEAGQEDTLAAVAGWRGSRVPFTFLAPGQRASDAFPPETITRLREIKRRHDPAGTFRANFPLEG